MSGELASNTSNASSSHLLITSQNHHSELSPTPFSCDKSSVREEIDHSSGDFSSYKANSETEQCSSVTSIDDIDAKMALLPQEQERETGELEREITGEQEREITGEQERDEEESK